MPWGRSILILLCGSWLEQRLRVMSRGGAAKRAIAKAIGVETPTELSVADIFDVAA
jgi:hypothetical protein